MGFGEVILNLVRFRMWWMLALMLAVTCGLAVLSAGPYYVGSKLVLQCPPHQCVDDLGSHTCGWSAQGFLPYTLSMM